MATRILIGDLGDVAPITVWAQTELSAAVGGEASPGIIAIRDIGITRAEFPSGQRVTVDTGPGSDPVWSGYLIKPSRRFWFSADKPDTLQRLWVLLCSDINILWSRRVTYKQSDPPEITGPKYTTDTWDDDALAELFANWVDLSSDDLDVTTKVQRVGHINLGQTTYPWNAGQTLGEAVSTIAQLPAAVFGINPSRQVVYADVDDENAPFELADFPGPGQVGYREFRLSPDGANLCNDALCWGFGFGSATGVFSREQDAASIAEHGLWQDAAVLYSVYKQTTINKVGDSIVNGSPESKRGRKNDAITVECVIHRDGLVAGDRVRVISDIWGYEDVLPVRKMRLKFPTPTDIRYELVLSHEIDRWGFQDPPPPFRIPGPYPIDIPNIYIPYPDIILEDPECGITDDFEDRTVVNDFGTSTSGIDWFTQASVSANHDVAFGKGFIYTAGTAGGSTAIASLGGASPGEFRAPYDATKVKRIRFEWFNSAITLSDFFYIIQWGLFNEVGMPVPNIRWGSNGTTDDWRLRLTFGPTDGVVIPDGFFLDGRAYEWTVEDIGGGVLQTAITDGTDTYSTTSSYIAPDDIGLILSVENTLEAPFTPSDRSWILLDVDIPEINSCTADGSPPPDVSLIVPPSGTEVCQSFTGNGVKEDFDTQVIFELGSAVVTVNGLYQTPGSDFEEEDFIGEHRRVHTTFVPEIGAKIVICYRVA